MKIIDARIRLPHEFRPPVEGVDLSIYHSQYDQVLNVSENRERTFEDLKQDMKKANIEHGIIHAEYEYGDHADVLNERVAQLAMKEPDLFSGFGTISMDNLQPAKANKQLEQVKKFGLLGINIQPSFFNIPIDHKKLYAVYSKAEELGLIVAIHTGVNYSTAHPLKYEHPLLLDQVACDFPNLIIIACHASWPWVPEIAALARKHPNLYLDFGGLAPKYIGVPGSGWDVLYKFMNNLLSDQLLFATDWPVFSMERAVNEWKGLNLKKEALEKILGGNAMQLIKKTKEGLASR